MEMSVLGFMTQKLPYVFKPKIGNLDPKKLEFGMRPELRMVKFSII